MVPALLLFDIDGTLMHSGGAGKHAMVRASRAMFGPRFAWDGVNVAGHLDPLIFAEAAAHNRLPDPVRQHERFRKRYIPLLEEELEIRKDRVALTPGMSNLISLLRRRAQAVGDVILGLLTGNYSEAVPLKLASVGVDEAWFTITAFGDAAPTRPDLTRLAMLKYEKLRGHGPDPRRVIVIGDTPRDIDCAHAHGCVAFAVATGEYRVEQLQSAGADYVVEDFSDPAPLIALL